MKDRLVYIALFYMLFMLSCSHTDEKKCTQFKRGEFYYKSTDSLGASKIVRNDSVQTVTDEKTGERLKERIVWTDSCTYKLYPLADNKEDILKSDEFPIEVKILEVTSKYYRVHVSSGNHKTDFIDTAWIVKLNQKD